MNSSCITGLLYSDGWIGVVEYAKSLGVNALHPALYHLPNGDVVQEAKRLGMSVNVWTVNEKSDMDRLIGYGVDGIITNVPDRFF